MRTRIPILLALFGLLTASESAAEATTLVVRGETVHTMAGPPLQPGVVVIADGRITAVGAPGSVPLPADAVMLEAAVVTPGLIDARSTVGLSGLLNQAQDQDQLETSTAIQPELRAIDAYNGRDPLVAWVRSLGFTTLHTGHAPGALVSGQTMVVKTWPPNVDEAVLVPTAMVAASLGPSALGPKDKPPGTAGKAVAMLRAELVKASEYGRKQAASDVDKAPPRNLRLESLQAVLERRIPLLVTVHRHQDILSALRLAREFNLQLVLDGVADAPLVLDSIRTAGFPVLVHPPMIRAVEETQNASFETPALLRGAGIPLAFQSGHEGYVPKTRVALFEAAIAVSNGLKFSDALAALTIESARILGVSDRIGSLEAGKEGDIALFDGDPFEYTTHCVGVVVSGQLTDSRPH